MKNICLTVLLCVVFSAICHASDYRKWTDAKSGKTITAEILDKKKDNSAAKIHIQSGKTLWIKAWRLSKEDQIYIMDWVKPVDHLSARVVGTRKGGYKRLMVTINAGAKELKVTIQRTIRSSSLITKVYAAGTVEEFEFEVRSDYVLKAYEGEKDEYGRVIWGRMVDKESSKNKTGL